MAMHETVSRNGWVATHLAPAGYFPSGKARPWRPCKMVNETPGICRIAYEDGSVDYCPIHGLRRIDRVEAPTVRLAQPLD